MSHGPAQLNPFDSTLPVTQAFGDAASAGDSIAAARRNHRHGMPTISNARAGVLANDDLGNLLWIPSAHYSTLVNSDFSTWTRGTSFPAAANLQWLADRWQWYQSAAGAAVTWAQDTALPTPADNAYPTANSLKMTIPTTADASLAAGDLYRLGQPIEGFAAQRLLRGMAYSFWVRAHRPGIYCVTFMNRVGSQSYVAEYAVNSADTWEYRGLVIPPPPSLTGFSLTTQVGLYVLHTLAAGSTYNGAPNATWTTTGQYATANQVNGVAATTDTFQIAYTNLIPGNVPMPLMPLPWPFGEIQCMRYAQQLGHGVGTEQMGQGQCYSTTQAYAQPQLPVQMHSTPSATFTAPSTFWLLTAAGGVSTCTAIALAPTPSSRVPAIIATVASGMVAGNATLLLDSGAGTARILLEANPA